MGIDAKKTHVLILHHLRRIEERMRCWPKAAGRRKPAENKKPAKKKATKKTTTKRKAAGKRG